MTHEGAIPDNTPVLVGVAAVSQRGELVRDLREPLDLMVEAAKAAGQDGGVSQMLADVESISVPRGRWSYRDPARDIGEAIGAPHAMSILSDVGVLQQTLISRTCDSIAAGEISCGLVVGGDAGHRLLRARITGELAPERQQVSEPDVFLKPEVELRHPEELRVGLDLPVGLYAIMESAWRARRGLSLSAHQNLLAETCSRMSKVAAENPDAWQRDIVAPAEIRHPGRGNGRQAFPYNRLHCSNWSVDQAAALLFCSSQKARALGVPSTNWVFPVAAAESNCMTTVTTRVDLDDCPGARLTGAAVLADSGASIADVDLIDLYSCFPLAVHVYAEAIRLSISGTLTITGGMPFAGGPYNNYLFQSVARAAQLIKAARGRRALLSGVSGTLTKQSFMMLDSRPGAASFKSRDFTAEVTNAIKTTQIVTGFQGSGRIAGYTVLELGDRPSKAVAVIDTPDARRVLACSEDPSVVGQSMLHEFVGRSVRVKGGEFQLQAQN